MAVGAEKYALARLLPHRLESSGGAEGGKPEALAAGVDVMEVERNSGSVVATDLAASPSVFDEYLLDTAAAT